MVVKRLVYRSFGAYDHAESQDGDVDYEILREKRECACCSGNLSEFVHKLPGHSRQLHMLVCKRCGWWHLRRAEAFGNVNAADGSPELATWWQLWHAVYSEIDIAATTLPIEDLRTHLGRAWQDRKHISAQAAEDLVASILREHYDADVERTTANASSADGGIDLYVVSRDGMVRRAVQVKRRITKPAEAVGEVRNFVGAMVLGGIKSGIFVTTADRFTEDARAVAHNANLVRHRLELEMINGERLLEMLEHTNASRPIVLPPLVTPSAVWTADDGKQLTTEQLLFEQLERIAT